VETAKRSVKTRKRAEVYQHEESAVLRPEAGTQVQFKKRRPPKRYRYDDSLSPALDWDGQNPARELGEWLLACIEEASKLDPPHKFGEPRRFGDVEIRGLGEAVTALRALGRPFLNWAGKAERASYEVPTLPLFVHERLSTKAILETLKAHERDRQIELQLFGDPQLSLAQQLEAYEHTGGWVNRMILGDSLVVMNSLLDYEGLGGQVQMIYIDPPYGVKFGSNFQPFVRRRVVRDGSDEDLTREPEMVKAYRDTWEVGIHSYLTYLRERLLVARDLLALGGSVFVQISDENVHHLREVMDEVFGPENRLPSIVFRKTTGAGSPTGYVDAVPQTYDSLLWYCRDRTRVKLNRVFLQRVNSEDPNFRFIEEPSGHRRPISGDEDPSDLPPGFRLFQANPLTSQTGGPTTRFPVEFEGKVFEPGKGGWKTNSAGMERLRSAKRLFGIGNTLRFIRYADDFPFAPVIDIWDDTRQSGFGEEKLYVVQTAPKVIARCVLMTTNPGDLVLDPTCGAGTTAYVAEQWGRRWITIDVSRVPLALGRQRLLTATFPYYQLQDPKRGPSAGFVYQQRRSAKGEEVGGLVPHITLRSIVNDEPAAQELLVDKPEVNAKVTRVTGAFCVEATIPTALNDEGGDSDGTTDDSSLTDRMLEVLRRNPELQLGGKRTIKLANLRPLAKSLTITAEADLEGGAGRIALVFGPENGAISERLVYEGAREAHARSYDRLVLIGFAIEAAARELVEKCADLVGISATYVQATPDLVMGDLLKTMRSSQIFSVTGLPDVGIRRLLPEERGGPDLYQVELRGLDVFDPTTMVAEHRNASDVPAWLLDTDYNDLCFLVCQAFFPRTSAWENLKRALHSDYEESVWEHLAGTTSAPFTAGERRKIAIKVIDDRGNELLVIKSLEAS
jgi:adenine-specific DNA-methyltransferase